MAYSVEKLGFGDVVEKRGLMKPSQFYASGVMGIGVMQ